MAQDRSSVRSDAASRARLHCEELRALAGWYREFAERAGNPDIWEARLRTAEDLEAEALRIESRWAGAASAAPASANNPQAQRLLDEKKTHGEAGSVVRRLAAK